MRSLSFVWLAIGALVFGAPAAQSDEIKLIMTTISAPNSASASSAFGADVSFGCFLIASSASLIAAPTSFVFKIAACRIAEYQSSQPCCASASTSIAPDPREADRLTVCDCTAP